MPSKESDFLQIIIKQHTLTRQYLHLLIETITIELKMYFVIEEIANDTIETDDF